MKNIHILPTDKPSRLIIQNGNKLILGNEEYSIIENRQNIYITSDEEIKGSDWVKNISFEEPIFKLDGKGITYVTLVPHLKFKKIILTTDQDLIKDGVQAIDDEFLEWFIKNPSCEVVEVIKDKCLDTSLMCDCVDEPCRNKGYKIIIPKEEPKQETLEEFINEELDDVFFTNISKRKEAERLIEIGAKWQQEQIGKSEFLQKLRATKSDAEARRLIFEQFKNK